MLSCTDRSTRITVCQIHIRYLSTVRIPAHCNCSGSRPSSHDSSLRTQTWSYRSADLLFSACHSKRIHRCRICREVHTAAPSVPSCSSSPVRRTSCCRNIRCCISPENDTGRSGCTDMDIPMSWYHRSYHGVRSADVFRSWSRFRRSMRSGRGKDAGSLRYHCLPLCLLPVRVCSVWTGSTVPMGRHQTRCTRSCCRYGMLSGLPPSRLQPHILRSDKLP